ncbi:TetR family transcriptional regulator [Nonomuraea sp. B10E15]|uniref:TetR family transcriptional regulator n=1 Tax=Nonomuraea sp. B10E15 TaxID=3153560 RepID=UPI00325E6F4C
MDTKNVLVESVLELFARHSFGGTSVRAITEAAGLSESVLYRHFDNKQQIFDKVLHRAGPACSRAHATQRTPSRPDGHLGLPGLVTNLAVAMAYGRDGELFVFATGLDQRIFVNRRPADAWLGWKQPSASDKTTCTVAAGLGPGGNVLVFYTGLDGKLTPRVSSS